MHEDVKPLTRRQREFVTLAARGLTDAQIALAAQVSPHTVKSTLSAAYRSLGVHRRAQAASALIGGAHAVVVPRERWDAVLDVLRDAHCAVPLHSRAYHRLSMLLRDLAGTESQGMD